MKKNHISRPLRVALLAAGLGILALAGGATPALAFEGHFRTLSFGVEGSGSGQFVLQASTANPNSPISGSGLAVNQTSGDVYIADTGNHRVDEFSSSGAFLRAWGWGVDSGANELQTCTSICQAGISGSGAGQLESPVYIAVDNSGGESQGDVYVADADDNKVTKFDSEGHLISSWGTGGQLNGSTTPEGSFGSFCGIAVDSSGNMLAVGSIEASAKFSRFTQAGAFLAQFAPGFNCRTVGAALDSSDNIYFSRYNGITAKLSPTGTVLNSTFAGTEQEPTAEIAVDRANNDVYIARIHREYNPTETRTYPIERYNSAGAHLETFGGATATAPGIRSADGLAIDETHPHRAYVSDAGSGDVAGFDFATVADATTEAASEVTTTTAKLNGSVNPLGMAAFYEFEYGTTSSYGQLTPASPEPVGSDSSSHPESAELSGLTPSTTYHFRINGITECASGVKCANTAADTTLTTHGPPIMESGSASLLEASGIGATIKTKVDPSGFDTHVWIEYGTSEGLGSETAHTDIGSATTYQTTNFILSGLQPLTRYHYRLVAENSQGKVEAREYENFPQNNPVIRDEGEFKTEPAAMITEQSTSGVSQHCITLKAKVNPDGSATEVFFEYGIHNLVYGQSTGPQSIGSSNEPKEVKAEVCGLNPGTRYHYRAVATNAPGGAIGADQTFETLPVARTDSILATEITETAAKLVAKVNPLGLQLTDCHFEYTSEEGFGVATKSIPCTPPATSIPANSSDHEVSASLSGLSANTTYRYRLDLANSSGTLTGLVHTFIFLTPPSHESCPANEALRTGPSAALPNCRAYELVTPPRRNGALIGANGGIGPQPAVAADGERVIAMSIQCFADAKSCSAQHADAGGSPFSFTRTSNGWVATALSPPASPSSSPAPRAYTPENGAALYSFPTPPAGEDDFYLREADGSFVDVGPNTAPAGGPKGPTGGYLSAYTQYFTPDLSHFVWGGTYRWPFDGTIANHATAYEYAGTGNSEPLLVGVSGGEGSDDLISRCGTILGRASSSASPGTLSADGRTVFFTAQAGYPEGPCPGGSGANAEVPVPANTLYARVDGELPDAHTVSISAPSPSECGTGGQPDEEACRNAPPASAVFFGASEDGTKAFFASTQQLTDEASEGSKGAQAGCDEVTAGNGCNLYLFDLDQPAGHRLTDISAGDISGEGPRVQGAIAISADGSHVYFVAKGVLAANQNENGEEAESGADNLYAYQRDAAHPEGHTAFVATLLTSDRQEWKGSELPGNVTPDGRYLVFFSRGTLTPDDVSRSGAQQIFRYDAQTETLTRVSIGERGFNDNGNRSTPSPCGLESCSEDASIETPGFTESVRRDPTMSNDGAVVFFQSPLALTPGALEVRQIGTSNEGKPTYAQNVYEWQAPGTELDGTRSCQQAAGCVSLISDGQDLSRNQGSPLRCPETLVSTPSAVCLLGTDTTGRDVFLSTVDRLVPQDTNTQLDYYDARVGGGFAAPPAPVPCANDACHGAGTGEGPNPSPSRFAGPEEGPSHSYQAPCKKGFGAKHGRCVKRRKHRKSHHKHKSHAKHKRASARHGGAK